MPRKSGDLVNFFVQRETFLQVFELHGSADFREDRKGVRIPLDEYLPELDMVAFADLQLGAIHDRVTLFFAPAVVDNGDRARTIHDYQIAGFRLHRLQVDEAYRAVVLGFEARLLGDSRCRPTDVERAHSELCSRFSNRLRRDHADRFAEFDHASGGQVAAVAHDADSALGFAGQHRANLYPLDACRLNRAGQLFGNIAVHINDNVAFVVFDLFERDSAHNAVAHRFDDLARLDDGADVDAVERSAILFGDNHILRYVHQAASEIAGISGLERRVRQSLASAVCGDEVLQHV